MSGRQQQNDSGDSALRAQCFSRGLWLAVLGASTLAAGCSGPNEDQTDTAELQQPYTQLNLATFQQGVYGYQGGDDTYIRSKYPDTNYGSQSTCYVHNGGASDDRKCLIRWSGLEIPPGNYVQQATVTLSISNSSPDDVLVDLLGRPWVESEATWNHASNADPWRVPGANSSWDNDVRPFLASAKTVGFVSFDIPAVLVQLWLNDPSTNQGIIISTQSQDGIIVRTSEYTGEVLEHPKLDIVYADIEPGYASESVTSSGSTTTGSGS